MEPHEKALDGLYRARDALNDVIEQMKKVQSADVVDSLSCYRVASLQVLENYGVFVDDLTHLTGQTPNASPQVHESATQMRTIRELLYDALAHAEDSLPTIDQLRIDEMRLRKTTHGNDWIS